jgi:quercetin dioxygenase-like cupin family protein
MKSIDPSSAARAVVAANPNRPAMEIIHDSDDVRMVVFRIAPGQRVAPHTSKSTVVLRVLEGSGLLSGARGEERACRRDDMVIYERGELHGMTALEDELLVMAVIAPRPGSR